MKKFITLLLTSIISFALVGCSNTTTQNTSSSSDSTTSSTKTTKSKDTREFVLPDLSNKTTDQVLEEVATWEYTNYQITVKKDLTYGDGEGEYQYEMFYGYAGDVEAGDTVLYSKKTVIYITAYNLYDSFDEFIEANPSLSEKYSQVTLEGKNYTNKSFISTGCGEVTVTGYVDGDTTRFKDKSGTIVTLRYLGVDTPESTAAFEPWGKAASAYTESCLSSAKKIVLEADQPGQKDGNERYLGWVWYLDQSDKWHNLNLEQILFCYTKDKADSSSTYGELATDIGTIIGKTGRRVWGEHDPNYDYSTDPREITIEELRTNFANYYAKKVKITGVIAHKDGYSCCIVDPETNYGIYYYIPSWYGDKAYDVAVGKKVTIIGTATYYGITDDDLDNMDEDLGNGSPQLTDFTSGCMTVLEEGISVEPTELNAGNLHDYNLGMFAEFKNLKVTKVYEASTKSGYTVTCIQDNDPTKIIYIRVDDSHYSRTDGDGGINKTAFKVGSYIDSVIGCLSYYNGYQVSLIGADYITFAQD